MNRDRKKYVLVIDAGNTSAHFGLFAGKRLVRDFRVMSNVQEILREGARELNKITRSLRPAGKVLIASVAPKLNPAFSQLCRKFGLDALFLSHRTVKDLRLLYRKPSEIGADRIANTIAAKELYGTPAVVVDVGTAITFDCISKTGAYMGGAIAPGPRLASRALAEHTGLLPLVEIRTPPRIIGKRTAFAIRSGIIYGMRALITGFIAELEKEMGGKPKVILTGGQLELIRKGWKLPGLFDPLLTLRGLRLACDRAGIAASND